MVRKCPKSVQKIKSYESMAESLQLTTTFELIPIILKQCGERDGLTQVDGAGSQVTNPLKKTGGTGMLELVHRPGPYAFRPTTSRRGGASPRVPFPIIPRLVHEGSNNAFRRCQRVGVGQLPCPSLAHLPVTVFNEVTQTFGPSVKNPRARRHEGRGTPGIRSKI